MLPDRAPLEFVGLEAMVPKENPSTRRYSRSSSKPEAMAAAWSLQDPRVKRTADKVRITTLAGVIATDRQDGQPGLPG